MAKNTIKVKKYSDHIEEYVAAGTITPGFILELTSSGTVQAHSRADDNVSPTMVALEDELQGRGIDDDYSADDQVPVWIPYRGDVVYALLEDGENIAFGDELTSAGNGKVKEREGASFGDAPLALIGIALEDNDVSGSSGADTTYRLLMMIT